MKKVFVTSWLLLLLTGVCWIFWQQEWKYNLPTPVPANYKNIQAGQLVDVKARLGLQGTKPMLVHFFNPDCPCSRFNVPHFNSLVKKYSNQFDFAVVVIHPTKNYTAQEIKDRFDLTVPVLFDSTIAASCGVYSTPQAVILSADSKLYFRGNYNKSRYCTDMSSNFAQMAMDSLLHNNEQPIFSQAALTAYGCQVNSCTK